MEEAHPERTDRRHKRWHWFKILIDTVEDKHCYTMFRKMGASLTLPKIEQCRWVSTVDK